MYEIHAKGSKANIQARNLVLFQTLVYLKMIEANPNQATALKAALTNMLDEATYDTEREIKYKETLSTRGDTESFWNMDPILCKAGHIVNPILRNTSPLQQAGGVYYPTQYKVTDVLKNDITAIKAEDAASQRDFYVKLLRLLTGRVTSLGKSGYDFEIVAAKGNVSHKTVAETIDAELAQFSVSDFPSTLFDTQVESLSMDDRLKLEEWAESQKVSSFFVPLALAAIPILTTWLVYGFSDDNCPGVKSSEQRFILDHLATPEVLVPFAIAIVMIGAVMRMYSNALHNEAVRGSEKEMDGLYQSTRDNITVEDVATKPEQQFPEQDAPVSKLLTVRNFIARTCGAEEIPASKTGMRQGLV